MNPVIEVDSIFEALYGPTLSIVGPNMSDALEPDRKGLWFANDWNFYSAVVVPKLHGCDPPLFRATVFPNPYQVGDVKEAFAELPGWNFVESGEAAGFVKPICGP